MGRSSNPPGPPSSPPGCPPSSPPGPPSKQAQTITFAALSEQTYAAGLTVSATVSASSGLPVMLSSDNASVATVSGSTITITCAGTTTIRANQNGNGHYDPAAEASQSLVVVPASQTVTFPGVATQTAGSSFALSATSNSGLAISYASSDTGVVSIAGSTASAVAPGSCTITATQAGNTNYYSATTSIVVVVVADDVVVDQTDGQVEWGSGDDLVISDATGSAGNKHLRLEVPHYRVETPHYTGSGTRPVSYLHMGAQRCDADEVTRGDDMLTAVGLTATPDYYFRDDYRRKNDEQHPNAKYHRWDGVTKTDSKGKGFVKNRTRELRTRGGWREHTDGNRITTTRGDRVEVVYGNYKLVVLGRLNMGDGWGESYWESSGGHNKDATNTPGEVIHIGWQPSPIGGTPTSTYPPDGGGSWKVTEETVRGHVIEKYIGNQYEWIEADFIRSTVGHSLSSAPSIPSTDNTSAQEQTEQDDKWINASARNKETPAITESTTATTIDNKKVVKKTDDWSMGGDDLAGRVDEYTEVTTKVESTKVDGTKKDTKLALTAFEKTGTLSQPVSMFKDSLYATSLTTEDYYVLKFDLSRGLYYETNKGNAVAFRFAAALDVSIGAGVEFALGTYTFGVNLTRSTEISLGFNLDVNIGLKFAYNTKKDGIGMTDTQLSLLMWFQDVNRDRIAAADKEVSAFRNWS